MVAKHNNREREINLLEAALTAALDALNVKDEGTARAALKTYPGPNLPGISDCDHVLCTS